MALFIQDHQGRRALQSLHGASKGIQAGSGEGHLRERAGLHGAAERAELGLKGLVAADVERV